MAPNHPSIIVVAHTTHARRFWEKWASLEKEPILLIENLSQLGSIARTTPCRWVFIEIKESEFPRHKIPPINCPVVYFVMEKNHHLKIWALNPHTLQSYSRETFINFFRTFGLLQEPLKKRKTEFESIGNEPVFVTCHPPLLELLQRIQKIAEHDVPVLLTGETGTGKDVLAHYIHFHSPRAGKNFVKINCVAIPSELLESELFGYRKGAFTDAREDYLGKVQLADGGTLFLDEIGDMPLKQQAKILRMMDTGEIDRLGDAYPIAVDVRIIAATNQHLEKLVQQGRFRLDLFYRINVVQFEIPPLRERKEDIPLLLDYFLRKISTQMQIDCPVLSKEMLKELLAYDWPGNVRELQNIVERLLLRSLEHPLTIADVREELLTRSESSSGRTGSGNLKTILREYEKAVIQQTLVANKFHIQQTARELGIDRTHLYRKMRQYGIRVPGKK